MGGQADTCYIITKINHLSMDHVQDSCLHADFLCGNLLGRTQLQYAVENDDATLVTYLYHARSSTTDFTRTRFSNHALSYIETINRHCEHKEDPVGLVIQRLIQNVNT